MSAIKYIGRNLWSVKIRHRYPDSTDSTNRIGARIWVATTGSHVKHGLAAAEGFLRGNENYPESRIVSIKHRGTLDA